jgi:hypothetical protein
MTIAEFPDDRNGHLVADGRILKCYSERTAMQEKGVIVLIFLMMATGATCYLMIGRIWILACSVTAGILYGAFFLKQSLRSRGLKGNSIGARFRLSPDVPGWAWGRQQRRDVLAEERRAHLEALRVKAHHLANTCHDIYGAQRYCLEIIGQTEKEDPLFMEACDLYMRTITDRPRCGQVSTPQGHLSPRPIRTRPVQAGAIVIPFPRATSRN